MIIPTGDDLLLIHTQIRESCPRFLPKGRIDRNKIRSIVEAPFMEVFGHRKYDTIYRQAACLMEGIIRLHPFPDGNKRTALAAASLFLRANGVRMVVPPDAVKFTVGIAVDQSATEEDMGRLVDRMATWIEDRCAGSKKDHDAKTSQYITKPARKMFLLMLTGIGLAYAMRQFRDWFAMDTHPDRARNAWYAMRLMSALALGGRPAASPR